jgi:hypothetical protein
VILVLALLAGVAACKPSGQADAKDLLAAIDNYRTADTAYKPAAAKAVEAVVCKADDVCAAKAACLAAIQPTVQGIVMDTEVRRGLDELAAAPRAADGGAAGTARSLADEASRARALLDRGHDAMPACDEKTTALRIKYHIE